MREEHLGGLTVRIVGGTDGAGGGDGPVIVFLHGFGAPGTDLVPLAGELDVPPGTRFVFPAAPVVLGLGFFGEARAWWMIDVARLEAAIAAGTHRDMSGEVPEGLAAAREHVVGLLDELPDAIGAWDRLVLGGFSQGAMLALDVALRDPRPLAGLVVLSGTLLAEREWLPLLPERAGVPVFQSHGAQDPLLPFAAAERLRDELTRADWSVRWEPFAGAHEIPRPVLTALSDFFGGVLS